MAICRTCVSKGTSLTAAAMLVVSESGDILSPRKAPLMTVAAVTPGSKPSPAPIPIRARPTVPIVPYEVPVNTEVMEQRMKLVARKNSGVMIFRPI